MLGALRKGCVKAGKGTINVYRYGYTDLSLFILPIDGHTDVERAVSVNVSGIFCVEGVVKVVEVCEGDGSDTEVVGYKSKCGAMRVVSEEASGAGLIVSIRP